MTMCCNQQHNAVAWTRACAVVLWPNEAIYTHGKVEHSRVDAQGRVRWAWMLHEGIPFLLRPMVAFRAGCGVSEAVASFKTLPGCGCIVALKSKYERVRAWINQRR